MTMLKINLIKPTKKILTYKEVYQLSELEKELTLQQQIYSTEKDVIKANKANWEMTKILVKIQKIKNIKL